MFTEIGSTIKITDPSQKIMDWCKANLVLVNPDYQKKVRMHLWVGDTPKQLFLYSMNGNDLILPFGCLRSILPLLEGDWKKLYRTPVKVDFGGKVPLYEYQEEAVAAMLINHYGILQSPAGSGKTQMGIALAAALGVKTLWLTHTKDLLTQSKARAAQYMNPDLLGTITEGKVDIGQSMTFATIQTMCKVDLEQYRDEWDCIIVDECHRVSGTPTAVTQFSKVLNALRARHKYGLSATVHRADGLIKATYAMIGEVVWTVPDEAVKSRVMTVHVHPKGTGVGMSASFLNSDGTVNYAKLISYLTELEARNKFILHDLIENRDHYNLVLSERVGHLKELYSMLPPALKAQAAVIDGTMTSKAKKAEREQAIEDMRTGRKRYLFATYALAKEGLDIPRLDRLFLTTPQKDYAVIVQSVGRVARTFKDKQQPIAYDYVDNIRSLLKSYKQRCTSYRKCGCEIIE
ncbi:MAG: DEAD/DEAH box helicase family protein [Lachnospiraceae bacterium]|nr:DEAD/DEAH box helicase family protein [Lachnospiraceae bacterium]